MNKKHIKKIVAICVAIQLLFASGITAVAKANDNFWDIYWPNYPNGGGQGGNTTTSYSVDHIDVDINMETTLCN